MTEAWPPNPYDFSTPAREEVFAGREPELALIKRFAASITEDNTAHLLIHGRRGIGKTSLLKQVGKALSDRGILHETLTLDDGGIEEGEFLLSAVLAISRAIVRAGGFGGLQGDFYLSLEKCLGGHPPESTSGPVRVASFVSATRGTMRPARVPDTLLLDDLTELVDEARDLASPGVVLMIDEADRLGSQPATVQRLRNQLVMSGLISTVVCGTDDVLTALDTAFAPTARHFQKVELRPLGDLSEVLGCVMLPLNKAGVLERIILGARFLDELHRLTRGSPYEIALLCNILYGRLGDSDNGTFELTDEVIEQVATQLKPSPEDEAALAILRRADSDLLETAARYCVDPQMTVHEHALLSCAFADPTHEWTTAAQQEVALAWDQLEAAGLATSNRNFLTPKFGELGRLFLKYRARTSGIPAGQIEGNYAERISDLLTDQIRDTALATPSAGFQVLFPRNHVALENGADPSNRLSLERLAAGDPVAFDQDTSFVAGIPHYRSPAAPPEPAPGGHALVAIAFEVAEDTFEAIVHFSPEGGAAGSIPDFISRVAPIFEAAHPYRARLHSVHHATVSADDWTQLWLVRSLIFELLQLGYLWESGDRRAAIDASRAFIETHAATLDGRGTWPDGALRLLNNLGFVELTLGHLVEAEQALLRASVRGGLTPDREPIQLAVLMCNLAVAQAGLGKYHEAIAWCDKAIALPMEAVGAAGWLCVYSPSPDWPLHPVVIDRPIPKDVAILTKASCMAQLDDHSAFAEAAAVTDGPADRWTYQVLEQIAIRLDRPDIAAEARVAAARAPLEEGFDTDGDGATNSD